VTVAGHRPALVAARTLFGVLGATAPEPPLGCVGARVARRAGDLVVRGPGGGGRSGNPGAELVERPGPLPPRGLPAGVCDAVTGAVLVGAALAGHRAGVALRVDAARVAAHTIAPHLLAGGAAPTTRVVAVGTGAVLVDGTDDDHADLDRLLAVLAEEPGPAPDAETVARRAQEWRLPVTPFRRWDDAAAGANLDPVDGLRTGSWPDHGPTTWRAPDAGYDGVTSGPLAGVTVVDMTVLWGGPLCTWLLAGLGATVLKVEPSCRPDGLRRGSGDDGSGNGTHFGLLHRRKTVADWDLRNAVDRARFEACVTGADVVVDNLSPRAAHNLGVTPEALRRLRPDLVTVSMPAFPAGSPERHWVAYGGGIHAIAGFGDRGDGGHHAPPLAWPDPLTGAVAFAATVAALVGRDHGWQPGHLEVSLRSAVELLAALPTVPREPAPAPDRTATVEPAWFDLPVSGPGVTPC
jgi:crotonobetainyl-CoA:carnitine CoA-transferase CaiB-like acyl-CoA transferase